MRRKALLALAFAAGLLNQQAPGCGQDAFREVKSDKPVIETFARSNKGNPERRAYYLLLIAESYLDGKNTVEVDAHYQDINDLLESRRWMHKTWDHFLERLLYPAPNKSNSKPLGKTESDYANVAIEEALNQLSKTENEYCKLCMTYIAAGLLQKLGNTKESEHYDQKVRSTLQAYENSKTVTIEQARAAVAISDSKAFQQIPLRFKDWRPETASKLAPYTASTFENCQKLKLRALKIADKLPPTEHERRKAHRDLVLWYETLGYNQLAKSEKQVLFNLVDCHDESILNPQVGVCGHLVWWQKGTVDRSERCGMG